MSEPQHSSDMASTAPDGQVSLISASGEVCLASRSLLIHHSPFFANLFSIPVPPTSTDQPETISLPSTTSGGLGLILSVLRNLDGEGKQSSRDTYTTVTADDLRAIAEAAVCADAYDIPAFSTAFVRPLFLRADLPAIVLFAVAAVTTYHDMLPHFARMTTADASSSNPTVPDDIGDILRCFVPDMLVRLEVLQSRYPSSRTHFRSELDTAETPGEGGFAMGCQYGCPAYKRYRYWQSLRASAAERVCQTVVRSRMRTYYGVHEVKRLVKLEVACDICAARLTRAFLAPVNRFVDDCNAF